MSDFLRILDVDGDQLDINHGGQPGEPGRRLLLLTTVSQHRRDHATSVALDERKARELVAFAQAWLDAPRLAARDSAEVVAEDDGVRLLKTTAGEWGVDCPPDDNPSITWFTGEHAERTARGGYADARGLFLCESCAAETNARFTTDDDVELCEACLVSLVEYPEAP